MHQSKTRCQRSPLTTEFAAVIPELAPALTSAGENGTICQTTSGHCVAMIRQKVQSFRQTIRELGWLNGWLFALERLLAAISRGRMSLRKYYFVAQPIPAIRWLPPQRGATLEVRRITESDPIIKEFPRPKWAVPYRFKQNAICLAEFKADSCIGFLWFTLGPYQEDEVRCRYVPVPEGKSAWDFDVYLHPEHRNGVAFLKLWDEANSFLATRGISWSLSRISAFNKNSIFSHARMGAKRIGAATFLSVGPFQICSATTPPYFHLSTHPDSFPIFVLSPEQARNDKPER